MSELKQFQSSKVSGKDSKLCCAYCNKPGHEEKTCFQKHSKGGATKVTNAAGGGSKVQSKCPICGISHTRTDFKGRKNDADRFKDCPKFMKMTVLERARQIENAGGCIMCLDWTGGHKGKECTWFKDPCKESGCGKMNSKFLHRSNSWYCNVVRRATVSWRKVSGLTNAESDLYKLAVEGRILQPEGVIDGIRELIQSDEELMQDIQDLIDEAEEARQATDGTQSMSVAPTC